MIVIGIETSCDETGIGIISDKKILSNIVASQEDIHSVYGGVVPELASRAHLSRIDNIFKIAIEKSGIRIEDIDLIGVTNHPGLKGSLLVGVSFACGLSYKLKKPIYFINHLHSHIAVNFLNENIEFPALGLVISGGHTSFFYIEDYINFKEIGRTLDDACGETFDKVGRILGLPFLQVHI
jgi:N6-L-threonylcarbamoyladenine synthase